MAGIARRLPRGSPALRRVAKAFAHADRSPVERMLGYFHWAEESTVAALFRRSEPPSCVTTGSPRRFVRLMSPCRATCPNCKKCCSWNRAIFWRITI
ncbi:MAG: hypothetical protein QM811_08140 [Pirellulales bacterium]